MCLFVEQGSFVKLGLLGKGCAAAQDPGIRHTTYCDCPSNLCWPVFGSLGPCRAVGRAYLVKKKGSNTLYAMKVLSKHEMGASARKGRRVMTEAAVLKAVDHPLIISLHWAFQSSVRDHSPCSKYGLSSNMRP